MVNKTITLPNGDKMPVVGLGTWQCEDPNELKSALDASLEAGYRQFDTAYAYHNETVLGEAINKWISKGLVKREELFITTKLPMSGVHPDRVEMFLNNSLKNLGLDYVDLYLVHFPVCLKYDPKVDFPMNENGTVQTEPTDHIAVWKKMEEQLALGKTRSIGLSNFSSKQISRILEKAKIKPANLQIEVHVYFQNKELVDFCKEKGISVVAYSPLGAPGRSKYYEKKGLPTETMPNVMEDPDIASIAKKHKKSPAQIMLKFLLQRGLVVIPKSVTPARIKQNIDLFDFELDEKDMTKLRSLDKGNEGKVCNLKNFKGFSEHPEWPYQ